MSIDYARLMLLFSNIYTDDEGPRNAAASRINDLLKRTGVHPSDIEIGPKGSLVYAQFQEANAILEREIETLRTRLAWYEPKVRVEPTPPPAREPTPPTPSPDPTHPPKPRRPTRMGRIRTKLSAVHIVLLRILVDRQPRLFESICQQAECFGYRPANSGPRLSELANPRHFGGALLSTYGYRQEKYYRITERGMQALAEAEAEIEAFRGEGPEV